MTTPERVTGSSYLFLGFLTFLNIMNFVDRQLLASFANFIVPDLGLSNTQFGLLTGLVFLTFYSTAGLFMGFLADTVNRTRLIAVGLAIWSLLTAASGAAKGFASLALPRMFIGVGESIMTPTAMSLLADRFPAEKLGFASGGLLYGCPDGRRREPAGRWLSWARYRLAQLFLSAGMCGPAACGGHVVYSRNAQAAFDQRISNNAPCATTVI